MNASRDALALEAAEAQYDAEPELRERWGPRGWEKTLQDARHNLEHLAGAVEMEDPAQFAGYVTWLDEVLRARGVPTDVLRRHLGHLDAVVARRLADDPEARAAVGACLAAGRAAVEAG